MKNTIFIMLALIASTFSAHAQSKKSQSVEFESTDSILSAQLNNVLNVYYQIKDALVHDNEKLVAAKAKEFGSALDAVDMKRMSSPEHTFFMPLQEKLAYDAEHISKAPNLDHMREHFGPFSKNIWTMVKAFKANNGISAYQQYCPMQKATWVSNEEGIKNPYYGKQMLSCGKTIETIK